MFASTDRRRQCDMRDEIARLEHGLALRCVARQKMKVAECDRACSFRTLNVNSRFERSQSNAHVRRIRRDAMLARAENRERTIVARDRRTADAGLTFVTRHRGVAKVN